MSTQPAERQGDGQRDSQAKRQGDSQAERHGDSRRERDLDGQGDSQRERRSGRRIAVGREDGFPVGKFIIVDAAEHEIGVVRLPSGELRAVRNRCPHKAAPICRGIVGGTWPPGKPGTLAYDRSGEVLICPWHGYEYDLNTGRELYQAVPTQLHLFPVTVEAGEVYVTL